MMKMLKRDMYSGSHTTMHLPVVDYCSKNALGSPLAEWLFFSDEPQARFSLAMFHFNGRKAEHYLERQEVIGDWMAPGFVITDVIGLAPGKFILVGSAQYSYGALVLHITHPDEHPMMSMTLPEDALRYQERRREPLEEHLRGYHIAWADMFAKQLTYWPENWYCRTYLPIPNWNWQASRETGEMELIHAHYDSDGDGVRIATITKSSWERSRADYLATIKEPTDVQP